MIIGRDLIVQLGLLSNLKHQLLQWYDLTVPMKEPSCMMRGKDPTSRDMQEVSIHTAEPFSTRESTERLVKILNSSYLKSDLRRVPNNATHLNSE